VRLGFLGGYGHNHARIAAAARHLEVLGVTLVDIPYLGFEGRPCPPDLETFVLGAAAAVEQAEVSALYATGLGGIVALFLRRHGAGRKPILMQAPELLGQARSLQLRLARHPRVQALVPRLLGSEWFERVAAQRYFERRLGDAERRDFFKGFAECEAMFALMRWITPDAVHDLKRFFRLERDLLQKDIAVWWGGRDVIVSEFELYEGEDDSTRVHWPVELFDRWNHYPMIDAPQVWAAEVHRHLTGRPREYAAHLYD
jgi:hypothetical protein